MCVGRRTCGRVYVRACVRALCGFACPVHCVRTVVTIPTGGANKQRWYDARLTRLGMGIGNPIYRTFFLFPLDTLFRCLPLSFSLSPHPSLPPSASPSPFRAVRANGLLDLRTFLTTISYCTDVFIRVMGIYAKPTKARSPRDLRERSRAKSFFSRYR